MASFYRKESILINVPASEIIKKCRFAVGGTGGDSDVTGYYTDDKPEKYDLIKNFISVSDLDWYVDCEKVKEYGRDIKNYVYPYKDKYVNHMDSFNHLIAIFGSHDVKIPAMFFGGSTGRYLKFDNSDELAKQFKELMYEGVSNFVVERRGSKFFVYPEIKKDFFKKLAIKISDIPPVIEEGETAAPVEEETKDLRKEFKKWLSTAKKSDGTPYSLNVQPKYVQSIDKACEALSINIWTILDYSKLVETLNLFFDNDDLMKNSEFNYKRNTSSALKCYKRFFEEHFGVEDAVEDGVVEEDVSSSVRYFPLNMILYGAPGTGKTYSTAQYAVSIIQNKENNEEVAAMDRDDLMALYKEYVKEGKISFTTFHQSYGYEDFIQGLRPKNNGGVVEFVPNDGVFKLFADKASKDKDNNYVLIIDEINRANISKVLGELITLLEVDKRSGELNEISVTLPSGEVFSVPSNLYIIGTMNTADKSISLIDVALRRRFEFVHVPVDYTTLSGVAKDVLSALNEKLFDKLDHNPDLLVGHAYFINKTEEDIPNVFNRSIIPLLYEYLFDDAKKVKGLLDEVFDGFDFETVNDKVSKIKVQKKVKPSA